MRFYAKRHQDTLAVCDEKLLGKSFEEGEKVLTVSESFYQGGLVTPEEAVGMIRESNNGMLAGNNIVDLALQEGLVKEYDTVKKIKYALYVKM